MRRFASLKERDVPSIQELKCDDTEERVILGLVESLMARSEIVFGVMPKVEKDDDI